MTIRDIIDRHWPLSMRQHGREWRISKSAFESELPNLSAEDAKWVVNALEKEPGNHVVITYSMYPPGDQRSVVLFSDARS